MDRQYRAQTPQVIYEAMGAEEVVINLDNGCYYSFNPAAAFVWRSLLNGHSARDMLKALTGNEALDAEETSQKLTGFLQMLLEEHLIESAETVDRTEVHADGRFDGSTFVPSFEKFTDMQEMLLLDPIHEVGDMGWPNPAQ